MTKIPNDTSLQQQSTTENVQQPKHQPQQSHINIEENSDGIAEEFFFTPFGSEFCKVQNIKMDH
jgi:hypothetical protein